MLFSDLGYELTVCKYNKTVLALYQVGKRKEQPQNINDYRLRRTKKDGENYRKKV